MWLRLLQYDLLRNMIPVAQIYDQHTKDGKDNVWHNQGQGSGVLHLRKIVK